MLVRLNDGREYELEQLGGSERYKGRRVPKLRLYRRVPHVKGSRLGKDHGGLITGSFQRVRVPRSSREWQEVEWRLQEVQKAAERDRDWRKRWAWRLGRAADWVRRSPGVCWRWARGRARRLWRKVVRRS